MNAIAQVPSLTLNPPTGSVSRNLISTSWEGVCDNTHGATVIDTDEFAGWTMLPVARGKDAAFEIWANGDKAANAQGKRISLQDAAGAGCEWLGLTNGVGSKYQAPGIAQTVQTIEGAQYTFTLDYAGQLGLAEANTRIGVYLDGQLLGSYANTSSNGLNWQNLNYSFQGDGNSHTLSVQLVNGTDQSTPRGAMIDALTLTETLPQSASTVYGFAGSQIALPGIAAQLQNNDAETLAVTLLGLLRGAILTDGQHRATAGASNAALDITAWNLNQLSLSLPNDAPDTLSLQVRAMANENDTTASKAKDFTVQILNGQACATPAGVNPYVCYANNASQFQTASLQIGPVVASALTPVSNGVTFQANCSDRGKEPSKENLANSFDALMAGIEGRIAEVLGKELENLNHKNE